MVPPQRVPGEFAARLGGEDGAAAAVVLQVSPLGKVWRAELRRAGGGGGPWQLGGGWAGFAAAHGVEAGWSVVFRLERRGVATVRAFDAAGCLARFCSPHAGEHVTQALCLPCVVLFCHEKNQSSIRLNNFRMAAQVWQQARTGPGSSGCFTLTTWKRW